MGDVKAEGKNRPCLRLVMAAAACGLASVWLSGCRKAVNYPGGTIVGKAVELGGSVAATEALTEILAPLRLFFTVGIGFLVLGSVLMVLALRRQGVFMLTMGLATTATGVLFSRYPWVVLVFALAAAVVLAVLAWDWFKVRRDADGVKKALAAAVRVIEQVPEGKAIKRGLRELGGEVEEEVREAIGPLKKKMRQEGRTVEGDGEPGD